MGEKGRVIEVNGNVAVVSFNRTEACAKCRACMSGFMESEMILEANNSIGAKNGDTVIIELEGKAFLTASFIMYAVPLMMMLAGFGAGQLMKPTLGINSDILSFIIGIGLMATTFITIRLFEKKIKSIKMFMPYIAEIVPYKAV